MKRYWIYFRGTRNGEHITAPTMAAAKAAFAANNGIPSTSGYIAGRAA
jgi:hypothetical protein